jgi:antitoxin component YwqK of YwqJK toxin-antitoxin module
MKNFMLLFFTLSIVAMISCAPGLEQVVAEKYANGTPKIIKYYKGEGRSKTMVKEAFYYPDGQVRMEGEYKEGSKHGRWVSFYQNGNKWSEGNYNEGTKDGKTITWHENGQKYYEGAYKNGERSGVWKFWDEDNEFIKEINYDAFGSREGR